MDYLLRDSYFSGVKCGLYDYNRLFMSILPVVDNNELFLAYKESGVDSIVEFINSRSSLFGQVYYHKTNRAFSAMLDKVCEIAKERKDHQSFDLFNFDEADPRINENKLEQLEKFYIDNSDDYFLNKSLACFVSDGESSERGKTILDDIINRKPWLKIYQAKIYPENMKIGSDIEKKFISKLEDKLTQLLPVSLDKYSFAVDIIADNAFKGVNDTNIKLLCKNLAGRYEIKSFSSCGDKFDKHQSIKYFVRVFVQDEINVENKNSLIKKMEQKKEELYNEFFPNKKQPL